MIQAPLTQIELRDVEGVVFNTLPEAILATTTETIEFDFTVPGNEQWVVLLAGVRLLFDSANLELLSVGGGLFAPGSSSPVSFTFSSPVAVPSVPMGLSAIPLQGIEIPPGYSVIVYCQVRNNEAVTTRNVIAGSVGRMLVRPIRAVTEIAVAQLVGQQIDLNLARRLAAQR